MKLFKIFFTLSFFFLNTPNVKAQKNDDFQKEWKKIAQADEKGLTKDALKIATQIFDIAILNKNDAQQIKAAMSIMRYRNMVEENNQQTNIFFVDTLIAKATIPSKNILQSMQAQLFQTYKEQNRYKLYSRTKLVEEKSKDIDTWSIDKLNNTISNLYKTSLKNEAVLKSTSINIYKPILEESKLTENLRPTLYDFLAHRAIDFFTNGENDVTQPANKFIVNDEQAFAPSQDFAKHNFKTKDTTSYYFNALKVMQQLLAFRLADAKSVDALLDADLKRLAFVNAHGIFTNKEKLYENALLQIETKYANNPESAQAAYLRAQLLMQSGNQYNAITNKNVQFDLVKAKEIAQVAVNKFPKSEGGINCANLLLQITKQYLHFEVEKVNTINDPFRALINFKNVDKIYCRLVKVSKSDVRKLYDGNNTNAKVWEKITALNPTKSWAVNLPNQNDLQMHHTEIKVDAMSQGIYFLLINLKEDFSFSKNILCRNILYVSNISYVQSNNNELYVLDRVTGKPLEKATLQTWKYNYDYTARSNKEEKGEFYTTDKNGFIKIKNKNPNTYYNEYFQIKHGSDELFTEDSHYNYYNEYSDEDDKESTTMRIFTDRSIYRPGQTVFFKGILFDTDSSGRKNNVISNKKTTITLYDNNRQKVNSNSYTTNEFGSISGNFILPQGLLNGQFSLEDSITDNEIYFNVEEYKRPKFLTEIKKPTGTYKVNDSIKVIGTAKAYAGNNVDGASVSYRVVRETVYPYWWDYYGRGGYGRNNQTMEIANGKTNTDAKGEFKITFKAIPDETVDKKNQPTFSYKVYADVTDINGETRSGNTTVAVSYQAIQLNINTKEEINSLSDVKITSTNINTIFEKAKVQVSIFKLDEPTKILRSRYWQQPDVFVLTKEEYYKTFPLDMYADENQKNKWELLDKLVETTDSTKENGLFKLNATNLKVGWYKIIATTKDKYGEEVKAEKIIRLSESISPSPLSIGEPVPTPREGKGMRLNEPINIITSKDSYQPNETIQYTIQTGFDKIFLIQDLKFATQKNKQTYPVINAGQNFNNAIPLTEADRGGVSLTYCFVKNNRYYEGKQTFYVPWTNKDLQITYETFRDKLEPGSTEKWKIKITGNKAEKVAAEALISMYDASLEQFKKHNWQSMINIWPSVFNNKDWRGITFAATGSGDDFTLGEKYLQALYKVYPQLLNNGWNEMGNYNVRIRGMRSMQTESNELSDVVVTAAYSKKQNAETAMKVSPAPSGDLAGRVSGLNVQVTDSVSTSIKPAEKISDDTPIKIRKNFNETAFFFPDLKTDAAGNIEFTFTMPEALTKWKMQVLGHTKEMASTVSENTTITQKQLMVQPNAPRFVREGDRMEFSAKIVNLTEKEITGTSQLELIDAATNKPVDGWFKNVFPSQYFTVAAGQSVAVKFPMEVPFNFNSAMLYRIKAIAKDKSFSDGEEAALPVLTNRMLVTESLPLNMRNTTTKKFTFDKLLNSEKSNTLKSNALTIEYTSNPAWYVVQALPYLIEYPYECAEQTFSRYYANTLAAHIANSSPKIKQVFEKWSAPSPLERAGGEVLISNLQKNEELKSVLLQETPWVLEAQSEAQQKKNIALLFDLVKLAAQKSKTLAMLKEMQSSNGGFVWFKGGRDDRYITQHIITGIGHLKKLQAFSNNDYAGLKPIIDNALPYLDDRLKDEYNDLVKYKVKLSNNNLSYTAIQYLYMRSFFPENNIASSANKAVEYYKTQAEKYWLSQTKYMQAMIALALHRNKNEKVSKAIIESLKQNSIANEEFGMYWKEFTKGGYYWHQAPIESQALMIEAFTDIDKNEATINDLKTWLLKQKQTQNWGTTKATAEACYALLLNGSNWLAEEKEVDIILGGKSISSLANISASISPSGEGQSEVEAGTGYFKKRIEGDKVNANMGNITVNIKSVTNQPINQSTTSWGAAYWQYFEDLDKITLSETPLKLNKKLFIEKNSDKGTVLQTINDGDAVKVGDKIKVRIELRSDRDMEYVHMKDMRASCMEPTNVISQYKWQGGLGYYETTKDASTNFFFGQLPKGTYVFEYSLFVTHTGNFSNGITTIQCMYAPEFTSHSEGVRVGVE
jgi:hypothetical protein